MHLCRASSSFVVMGTQWYVYLLRCADNTFYCGITTDPVRRLDQHNGLKAGGARYTRARRPVQLEAMVAVPDRAAAARLEKAVQGTPRSRKKMFLLAAGKPLFCLRRDSLASSEMTEDVYLD